MYIDQINWKGEEYDIYSKEVENASTGVVNFDSEDSLNPSKFDDSVDLVESGETLSELCEKFSATVKNVRYLGNLAGDTDISNIDSGTLTGAIQLLNETLYDSDGNIRLGTDDVGSEIQFIYLDKGKPTATTVATVGTSTKPIYINNGKFTESNATRGAWNRIMYMSSGSLVESDGAVGEDEKSLIYMKDGYFYKSGESVGSDGKTLMYLNSGTLTASSSTVGSGTQPVYLSSGTITACDSSIGNFNNYLPLSGGTLTGKLTINSTLAVNTSSTNGIVFTQTGSEGSAEIRIYQNWSNNGEGRSVSLHCGQGGDNRGLNDDGMGAWIIYHDKNDQTCIPHATTLSSTLAVSGATTLNSYLRINTSNAGGIIYTQTSSTSSTSAQIEVVQNWSNRAISLHCGSSGNYRGIYDNEKSSWIIAHDANDEVYIPSTTHISGNYIHVDNGKGLSGNNSHGDWWTIAGIDKGSAHYHTASRARFLFGTGTNKDNSGTEHYNYILIGTDSHTYEIALRAGNSSTTGSIYLGTNSHCRVCSQAIAQNTNSSTRYVAILGKEESNSADNFRLVRSTSSSERYKNVIRKLMKEDIERLYDVPVYLFKYKENYLSSNDERYNREVPGFIAERLDEIIPIAVDHENNQPESWNSNIIIPLMFEMIKNNHTLITELQEQIAQLTN